MTAVRQPASRQGGGGDCGQGASNPIAKISGKIAGKLRCCNQTSRSLTEQHVCTGDTQGTKKHARGTSNKQLQKNCGKLPEIAKSRKIADLNPYSPCSEESTCTTSGTDLSSQHTYMHTAFSFVTAVHCQAEVLCTAAYRCCQKRCTPLPSGLASDSTYEKSDLQNGVRNEYFCSVLYCRTGRYCSG